MTNEPSSQPPDAGELEYGSILPNGEDWRLRKFDAGMGEKEYRIFRNEVFFAMFDNRQDADVVMSVMTHPVKSAEKVLDEAISLVEKEIEWCSNRSYCLHVLFCVRTPEGREELRRGKEKEP